MGYKFPILIAQLITRPLMQSWNTRRYEIADDPGAPQRISQMFTYYLFLTSFAGLILAAVIKPLFVVLTPQEFHGAYRITRVEIVTIILRGAYYHLVFGIFYAKDTKTIAKLRGWSAALKIPLTWVFISTWGIFGAAYSAAITNLIVDVVGFRLAQKHYRLDLEWNKIGAIVGTGLVMFLLITNWDFKESGIFMTIDGQFIPWAAESLNGTFIGHWKDGKAIQILIQRSAPLSEIMIRGSASLLFVGLMPLVHTPTRKKISRIFFGSTKNQEL